MTHFNYQCHVVNLRSLNSICNVVTSCAGVRMTIHFTSFYPWLCLGQLEDYWVWAEDLCAAFKDLYAARICSVYFGTVYPIKAFCNFPHSYSLFWGSESEIGGQGRCSTSLLYGSQPGDEIYCTRKAIVWRYVNRHIDERILISFYLPSFSWKCIFDRGLINSNPPFSCCFFLADICCT